MRVHASAVSVALLLALAACTLGPSYERPQLPVPDTYYQSTRADVSEAGSLADLPWWQLFDDPTLNALIDEAVRNGFDAQVAAARVEEARAQYGVARSEMLPAVEYGGSSQRGRDPFTTGGDSESRFSASAALSWELDMWGRIRRQSEAAWAEYLATEEGRRGVLLSLSSDVAIAYADLRELDQELAIAKRTVVAFQDTYDLFNSRLEGGAASALQTARAAAALASVASQVSEIQRAIVARENQINFLLGRNPQPIPREGPEMAVPPDVPAGLPSTLLERRPDVRQAEELLVAANAEVGATKAEFFPTLSLTGALGSVSPELSDLFSSPSEMRSLGSGLLGPIFQGGRTRSRYAAAQARWEQARTQYASTAANAFGEVSRALVDRAELVNTERERAREVTNQQEAVHLANLRYESGLSSYFEVLEAQQQLFPAELALARARRDRLVAVVNLYRALGGGWQQK